ncbi:MBL fold metallo-hydrolase [Candidatus Bathyarchaeota archaeon]|nr:MBL fold metallo-hydrolase [Candidatus Bathyarchaeota archaeon]
MLIHTVNHKLFGLIDVSKSFIIEDSEVILVDTGINSSSANNIINVLARREYSLLVVTLCILTHSHRDHVGGLASLKKLGNFQVAAHEAEADDIEKSTGIEVDLKLRDGDILPCGIKVIYLPGHTLGSIALLAGNTLIAGDALRGSKKGLKPSPSLYTKDKDAAYDSIHHLTMYDFDKLFVSHGENIESNGKEALKKLIESLN